MPVLFSRLRNLKRISDLYNLFRNYIEKPDKRNKKQLSEMWDKLSQVTEFKELIARERMETLKGNKTYIVAALAGLATVAKTLGYIDEDTYTNIMGFLGTLGAVTMAAKINHNTLVSKSADYKINTLAAQMNQANYGSKVPDYRNPPTMSSTGGTSSAYNKPPTTSNRK